jgi:hypothetical protein
MTTVLIAGTKKGAAIFKSDDRRKWSSDFVLKGWHVTASARDDKGRYYVAIASDVFGPAIMVSDDLKEWTQLEAAPRFAPGDKGNADHHRIVGAFDFEGKYKEGGRFVDQIWTLVFAHGKLYAGVSEAGLFVSKDRGASWQGVDGFNNHPSRGEWMPGAGGLTAHTILSDANNPNRMWVGVSAAGLFRTDDGGKTWSRKNDGIDSDVGQCVHRLTHDPKNADLIYRQDHRGVYKSVDAGDTWQRAESGLPIAELSDGHKCSFGFPIVMDRASHSIFAVPLDGDNFRFPANGRLTVYRSNDGAAHWNARADGLPQTNFAGILRGAMTADQKGGVYFGTTSGVVFGTSDLGEHWSEVASGLPRILSVEAYA